MASIIVLSLFSGSEAYSGDIVRTIDVENKPVTVFAASGTMVALGRIAKAFQEQTGQKVLTNVASSSTLARQITAGADFDVYISANPKWMNCVQDRGLIENESRQNLLADKLALIAPVGRFIDNEDRSIPDIINSTDGYISIGDAIHVPCGAYTKQALTEMNCWDAIKHRCVPAASVRAAQQYVESGQCDLGIVYRASAAQSDKVQVLGIFDESLHSPVQFIVASSVNSEKGSSFIEFLKAPVADHIFVNAGFRTYHEQSTVPSTIKTSSEGAFSVNEWKAFLISLKVAATCTLVVAAPGIGLGYVLARKSFRCQSLVNAVVCVPMVIPPVVTGYLALLYLGKNSFIGKWLDEIFGFSVAFSWVGAVVVSAIMGFPLLVRSVKTAVEMIDQRYNHAANTLGSGPVRTFFTITLPLAGPGVLAGLILAFARSLGEFGATATFAGNIPGKTQTLSLAIYNFTQIPGAESAAMRLVGISVLLSFAAMFGSELLSRKMKTRLGVAA